jgi:hypothetical protein
MALNGGQKSPIKLGFMSTPGQNSLGCARAQPAVGPIPYIPPFNFSYDAGCDRWPPRSPAGRANYVIIVVVIGYDTAATARWTLMFIVLAFIDHTITVAVWTRFSFHGAVLF